MTALRWNVIGFRDRSTILSQRKGLEDNVEDNAHLAELMDEAVRIQLRADLLSLPDCLPDPHAARLGKIIRCQDDPMPILLRTADRQRHVLVFGVSLHCWLSTRGQSPYWKSRFSATAFGSGDALFRLRLL